jgi:hypothetical protein
VMNIPMPGPTPRITETGLTGSRRAEGFVAVRVEGVSEWLNELRKYASILASDEVLFRATAQGGEVIKKDYKRLARSHMATGNLAASTKIKKRKYSSGVYVAVVGPEQTGSYGTKAGVRSGNHAFWVEFGTGTRRPGTQNRRAYVNVHQMVNRRMTRHPPNQWDDESFERAGRGFYFLMGSLVARRDQPAGRAGYSRDFAGPGDGGDGRKQHPISLKPGESIAPMPALGLMSEAINSNRSNVENAVISVLRAAVARYAA